MSKPTKTDNAHLENIYFTRLSFETYITVYIFMTIQCLKIVYLTSTTPSIVASPVLPDRIHLIFHRIAKILSCSPLYFPSVLSMSFRRYGIHACIRYSKLGLTIALYRGTISKSIHHKVIMWRRNHRTQSSIAYRPLSANHRDSGMRANNLSWELLTYQMMRYHQHTR